MDVETVLQNARTDRRVIDEKLQELEDERDRIDSIVTYLEAQVRAYRNGQPSPGEDNAGSGPYSGMVLAAAAADVLRSRQQWLKTHPLIEGLLAGGYKTGAKSLYLNCFSTLSSERKKKNPRVVKNGPKWGLPSWTPGVDPADPPSEP